MRETGGHRDESQTRVMSPGEAEDTLLPQLARQATHATTTIINTIEADGEFWTVVLTHGCTPESRGGQLLVFIRDWTAEG
jgi:hypothetical protein